MFELDSLKSRHFPEVSGQIFRHDIEGGNEEEAAEGGEGHAAYDSYAHAAAGAGAGARCGMGVAVVGGMTFATLCGLFLIPAFYIVSEYLARYFRKVTGFKGIKFKHRMLRR